MKRFCVACWVIKFEHELKKIETYTLCVECHAKWLHSTERKYAARRGRGVMLYEFATRLRAEIRNTTSK